MNVSRVVALLAATAVPCTPLAAQDALVLSGGGSRGLAHPGAMRGLEQRGFAPRIVVGTSMGAIMGALFAAGYAPDSIAGLLRSQDFTTTFSQPVWLTGPQRAGMHPLLVLRVGDGDDTPAPGLVADARINRALVHLLFDAGARARSDFDALPRRFRAIAADLATGDAVVLERGDLARAVRASMAVPGLFAPVAAEQRLLIDGGIANYLPVFVARVLGARRVVAVDVLRPGPEVEGTAPLAVAFRGFRHVLSHTLGDDPAPDVLVLPRIPQSVSAAYFPRNIEHMLALGEAAALAAFPPHSGTGNAAVAAAPPARLDTLIVEGSDATHAQHVRAAFADVVPGEYDARAVLRAVDRLYANGLISGIWPRVEASGTGTVRLVVRADVPPRTRLSLSPAYDSDIGGRLRVALRHRVAAATELTTSADIGGLELAAALEAAHVLAAVPALVLSVGVAASESDVRVFDDSRISAVREVERAGAWVSADWRSFAPEWHASLALRAEQVSAAGDARGFSVGPLVRIAALPRAGRVAGAPPLLEAEWRTGDLVYRRMRAAGSIDAAVRSVQLALAAALDMTGGDAPPDMLPSLGDEVPGLRAGRERASVRVIAGPDVAYPLLPFNGFARLRVRTGFAGDDLDEAWNGGRWTTGAELAAFWPTPIGAALIGVGGTVRGDWRVRFRVGATAGL